MIANIKQILDYSLNVNDGTLNNNSAYMIYQDLYNQLIPFEDLNLFLFNNDINDKIKQILARVELLSSTTTSSIVKYHIIGDYLVELLTPRFIKENKRPDNISKEDHIRNWFKQNHALNYITDRLLVQAGF